MTVETKTHASKYKLNSAVYIRGVIKVTSNLCLSNGVDSNIGFDRVWFYGVELHLLSPP